MSHIFDGLRRSEHERSGIDWPALSGTELLQHAERQAVSKWEVESTTEEETAAFCMTTLLSDGTADPAPTVVKPSRTDERSNVFDQFQPLRVSLSPQSRLPSLTDSASPAAEAFRLLAVRLRHLRRDRPFGKLLITSSIPQEGKSMVAANLACSLALGGAQKILLLEGDLRRPTLSQVFGLTRNPGLCERLEDAHNLVAGIYYLEGTNIWLLPANSAPTKALELLKSGRLSALMDELSVLFDWIIIDAPPVLPLADTSVWMRLADGILLTTRPGTTEKRKLAKSLGVIETTKLIGALVNCSQNTTANDYYHYYCDDDATA